MRFNLAALATTLFAGTVSAGTALIHTLDQENCVLTFEDFDGWSGTTQPIGTWHWETNTCSSNPENLKIPKVVWPEGAKEDNVEIFYNFIKYNEGQPGMTTIVHHHGKRIKWTQINPYIVGTPQTLPFIEDSYAPGL